MKKQVDKSHYEFSRYIDKRRWMSMWHQLDEVLRLEPERVLEIGPGPGIFKAVLSSLGVRVETLDIDPELCPDHVASVLDMPFEGGTYDVVCAFQVLEHLPFEKSIDAFHEMTRVSRHAVLLSLPDAATRWPVSIYVPKLGTLNFFVPKPRWKRPVHVFDGQHYWEVNKRGFSLEEVERSLMADGVELSKTYRVGENPYHRFFLFGRRGDVAGGD